jgi:hypothetical protein
MKVFAVFSLPFSSYLDSWFCGEKWSGRIPHFLLPLAMTPPFPDSPARKIPLLDSC